MTWQEFEKDPDKIISSDDIVSLVRTSQGDQWKILLRHVGDLPVRLAFLQIAMEEKSITPYTKNYPPVYFIAHKWESAAQRSWVKNLAEYIKGRGYNVFLDQDALEETASNFLEVPQFIANMVNCNYFLIIVTEKYLDFVQARNNKTSWVYDEYQSAVLLNNSGKLKMQAILLEGNVLPQGLLMGFNAADMRTDRNNFSLLDKFIPIYDGPQITINQKKELEQFIIDYDNILAMRDGAAAAKLLENYAHLNMIYDYKYRLANFYWEIDKLSEAYQIALNIKDECDYDAHVLVLCSIFKESQDYPTYFRFVHHMKQSHKINRSIGFHYLTAGCLKESNSVFAARNHYGWLAKNLTPEQKKTLSLWPTIEEEWLALDKLIAGFTPKHLFYCNNCNSEYPFIADFNKVCGQCGTLYEENEIRCPVCENEGIIPLQLLLPSETSIPINFRCPVCNDGTLNCKY